MEMLKIELPPSLVAHGDLAGILEKLYSLPAVGRRKPFNAIYPACKPLKHATCRNSDDCP